MTSLHLVTLPPTNIEQRSESLLSDNKNDVTIKSDSAMTKKHISSSKRTLEWSINDVT